MRPAEPGTGLRRAARWRAGMRLARLELIITRGDNVLDAFS